MATKTKRAPAQPWTEEKRDAALEAHRYIKIGDKRGTLLLSGAEKKWKEDPTFTYVSELRVAGRPADLRRVLADVPGIDRLVAGGYTAASAAGALRAQFEAEVEAQKAHSKAHSKKVVKAATVSARSIADYAAMVDEAKVAPEDARSPGRRAKSPKGKKASPKGKKASPKGKKASKKATRSKSKSPKGKKGSPKRKTKPLGDKVAALSEGKVMDVSKLHVDGSGAKTMDEPKGKSKKIVASGYRIASDNKRGINAAARLLEDDGLVAAWEAAKAAHGEKASPKRKTKTKSPKSKSPAPTLPMSSASSPSATSSPGGRSLPPMPSVRVPTIGSPRRGSPRL